MKKLSPQMAEMVLAFMQDPTPMTDKLKKQSNSYYGFGAEKGKFIPFLTPEKLAEALVVSPKTLERWRREGFGPAFLKAGNKRIRYPVVELDNWVRKNIIQQDSEESLAGDEDSQQESN